jgi:hypothetical protein
VRGGGREGGSWGDRSASTLKALLSFVRARRYGVGRPRRRRRGVCLEKTLHARPALDAAALAAATSTTVRERRGARTWERAEERRGRSHGAIACPNSESSAFAPARTRRGRRSSCGPRIRHPRAFAILVRPSLSPVILEPSPVSTCMLATTSAHTHEQVRPVDRAEPVRLLSHN